MRASLVFGFRKGAKSLRDRHKSRTLRGRRGEFSVAITEGSLAD